MKYKPRKYLDLAYFDWNNEFDSVWIEAFNNKIPNKVISVDYRHALKTLTNIFDKELKNIMGKI